MLSSIKSLYFLYYIYISAVVITITPLKFWKLGPLTKHPPGKKWLHQLTSFTAYAMFTICLLCPLLNYLLSALHFLRFLSFYVFCFCNRCSSLGWGPARLVRWSQSCPVKMCLNVTSWRQCLRQWWMDCWNATEDKAEHCFVVSVERQWSKAVEGD